MNHARNWRINFVLCLIFFFAAAIMGRLVFLQIIKYDFYSALAKGQERLFAGNITQRGEIFFSNNELPIATNKVISLGDIKKKIRSYPYASFASHILGFVNDDGEGQYGAEGYWDKTLRGKDSDLYLTIDYNIQYQAEKLLKEASRSLRAEGGTIIVMEPVSGRILALANSPDFDPNNYSKQDDMGIFQSDAFQKIFEPGSAFKPITMAAALDKGAVTPQTTFKDPGVIKIGKWEIYNYDQRTYQGDVSMTEVLEKSINTGAVFAERQLGDKDFLRYIERFGIFEKTGIDLQGEVSSANKELKQGYEINFATASFGQGIEMTPLQLARAFSVIANGGKFVRPYLAQEQKNDDNEEEVISPITASRLTAMLVSVVENGFGKAAKITGYYIAGKTGTAQVSFSSLGVPRQGYSDKTWQSFIGFAPAFNPQFLILVKLNNPQTKTAEYSAAPIFRDLAKYIIDYYQIPPDY